LRKRNPSFFTKEVYDYPHQEFPGYKRLEKKKKFKFQHTDKLLMKSPEDYTYYSMLGQGAFGNVRKCILKQPV